jgi:hypothetical protein
MRAFDRPAISGHASRRQRFPTSLYCSTVPRDLHLRLPVAACAECLRSRGMGQISLSSVCPRDQDQKTQVSSHAELRPLSRLAVGDPSPATSHLSDYCILSTHSSRDYLQLLVKIVTWADPRTPRAKANRWFFQVKRRRQQNIVRYLRNGLKPARTSSANNCGCSHAAKCPPLSILL